MAKLAEAMTDGSALLKSLDELVSNKEEELTRTHSVREILFDGFSVEKLANLSKPDTEDGEPKFKLPESFADDKFGFYKNVSLMKNGCEFHGIE
jgi:hypothetical protein